jgi:hypothetical protein
VSVPSKSTRQLIDALYRTYGEGKVGETHSLRASFLNDWLKSSGPHDLKPRSPFEIQEARLKPFAGVDIPVPDRRSEIFLIEARKTLYVSGPDRNVLDTNHRLGHLVSSGLCSGKWLLRNSNIGRMLEL